MNTPNSVEADQRDGGVPNGNGDPTNSASLSTCLCCLIGWGTATVIGILLLPTLIAFTRSLGVLSSTTIVCLLLVVWLLSWLTIEYTWENHDEHIG